MKKLTQEIVTEEVAQVVGWSLLRSAMMNTWGACTQLARKDVSTANGGIDAYNESIKTKDAQKNSEDFAFASGLETSTSPIQSAREWMGVIEILYPLMNSDDRLHPEEFINERLKEKPNYDIPDSDLETRVRVSGKSEEEVLKQYRDSVNVAWDKQSEIRFVTKDIFKTISGVEESPNMLLEKIENFLDSRIKNILKDSYLERANIELAKIELIKLELKL